MEYSGSPGLIKSALREMRSIKVQLDGDPPIESLVELHGRCIGYLRLLAGCAMNEVDAKHYEREAERHEEKMQLVLERAKR